MDNHVINGVIATLRANDHYLPTAWLYEYGNGGKPVTDLAVVVSELKRLDLIYTEFDNSGYEQYLLTVPARRRLDDLPIRFKDDPYGYFLHKESQKNEITEEKLDLEISKLRNEFQDYQAVKQRAEQAHQWGKNNLKLSRLAIIISIATLIVTILTVFLSRYRIWPFDQQP